MTEDTFDGSTFLQSEDLPNELWLPAIGGEGRYEISNMGRISSITKFAYGKHRARKSRKILKQFFNDVTGYYQVVFGKSDQNKRKKNAIHRMVGLAFIQNPDNKPEINHKKGNKRDNRASELEWNTRPENIQHAFKTGLINSPRGENTYNSILTDKKVIFILNSPLGPRALSRKMKLSYSTVNAIKNGSSWNHITGLPKKKWGKSCLQ